MQTMTFASAAAVTAAVQSLASSDRLRVLARSVDGGGFALDVPDDLVSQVGQPAPLATTQAAQVALLKAACANAILTGGFASSALGALHGYPSDETSQRNLLGSVQASLLPNLAAGWTTPFWCADTTGAWTFAPHTAAQIQQVGTDAKAAVVAAQQKLQALTAQVAAATTAAAAAAIVWA